MIGAMVRKEIDVGGSPIFFRSERAKVVDFTARTWIARYFNGIKERKKKHIHTYTQAYVHIRKHSFTQIDLWAPFFFFSSDIAFLYRIRAFSSFHPVWFVACFSSWFQSRPFDDVVLFQVAVCVLLLHLIEEITANRTQKKSMKIN